MITDAILKALAWVLTQVSDMLPTSVLDLPSGSALAAQFGGYMGPINQYVPLAEMWTLLALLLDVYVPAVVAYVLANWLYRHFPMIGGGG